MRPSAAILAGLEWFAGCSPDDRALFATQCRVLHLDRDGIVYSPPADAFFVLLTGRVGAWRATPLEAESMLYFIADAPGTTLRLANVVAGIPYFATMRSLDRGTEVLVIPAEILGAALAADSGLGLANRPPHRLLPAGLH